jgi:pheromone shutdown protein TraB
VPVERFARFLAAGDWRRYNEDYERHYLAGDLDGLAAAAQGFPTYCEPVIGRRDAVLAERMAGELDAGGACVIVGVAHCPGVLACLKRNGYRITGPQCS